MGKEAVKGTWQGRRDRERINEEKGMGQQGGTWRWVSAGWVNYGEGGGPIRLREGR